jgi:hypothetical protein
MMVAVLGRRFAALLAWFMGWDCSCKKTNVKSGMREAKC